MQNGRAARRAEGDADNYSRTLSHRRRLTLQTDWQMKRAEIASIKKQPLARIRGSSPISCLKWETERKMSVHGKLSPQFNTLQRPFRLHAQNSQWYLRGFKVQIQWNIKIEWQLFKEDLHPTVLSLHRKTFCDALTAPLYVRGWTWMRDAIKNIHWLAEIALFIKQKINKYISKSLHVSLVGDQRRCSLSCQARRQIDFQSWMLLNLSAAPSVCLIYTAEYRIQINSLWRRMPVERLITCETRMTWLRCVWELTAFACWDWMCNIFLSKRQFPNSGMPKWDNKDVQSGVFSCTNLSRRQRGRECRGYNYVLSQVSVGGVKEPEKEQNTTQTMKWFAHWKNTLRLCSLKSSSWNLNTRFTVIKQNLTEVFRAKTKS